MATGVYNENDLRMYLPGESQEVHDVVYCGSVFKVSAINGHRVLELLTPRLGPKLQPVEIEMCQRNNSVKQSSVFWNKLNK